MGLCESSEEDLEKAGLWPWEPYLALEYNLSAAVSGFAVSGPKQSHCPGVFLGEDRLQGAGMVSGGAVKRGSST